MQINGLQQQDGPPSAGFFVPARRACKGGCKCFCAVRVCLHPIQFRLGVDRANSQFEPPRPRSSHPALSSPSVSVVALGLYGSPVQPNETRLYSRAFSTCCNRCPTLTGLHSKRAPKNQSKSGYRKAQNEHLSWLHYGRSCVAPLGRSVTGFPLFGSRA